MNASRAQARLSYIDRISGEVVYAKCDKRAYVRKQKYYSTSLSGFRPVSTPRACKHVCRTGGQG